MKTKENIKVEGYRGTWYVIDETVRDGRKYYLLESEKWGDEAPHLLVDAKMNVIADDMYDNIEEQIDCSL